MAIWIILLAYFLSAPSQTHKVQGDQALVCVVTTIVFSPGALCECFPEEDAGPGWEKLGVGSSFNP